MIKNLARKLSKGFVLQEAQLTRAAIAITAVAVIGASVTMYDNIKIDKAVEDVNDTKSALQAYFSGFPSTTGSVPENILPARVVTSSGTYNHGLGGSLTITLNSSKTFDIAAAGLDDDHCRIIAGRFNMTLGNGKTDSMAIDTSTFTAPTTSDLINTACGGGAGGNTITFVFSI